MTIIVTGAAGFIGCDAQEILTMNRNHPISLKPVFFPFGLIWLANVVRATTDQHSKRFFDHWVPMV
ncbi:hypothetical protein N5K35_24550 [Pseudomonas sp. GD03651]|uniref:hypothetical protein n=1 Tax=Pseudomonas TaxID=286 RepID=UPI001182E135|nr:MULTISPECIES: hypothetical protein [Pseudomonas]MDH2186861.1 hypothetical protein [Pseudomonas sp. GD03651]HDS1809460.1 hypothetical protein [Pseudomonas putida]HDS3807571.1 hypothetical protein [Pseudomonas putida]